MTWTSTKPVTVFAKPSIPNNFAIGNRMTWNGIKQPNNSAPNKNSLPLNFHLAKEQPLNAPTIVDIMTAGKTIRTLFQKYGAKPLQSLPVQADDQAFFQA